MKDTKMKKVLVWETLATISGGQKMTLTVMDLLSAEYEFCCLIPGEGRLSEELKKRKIPYVLMGDQTLPKGVKGKKMFFRYGWMSIKYILKSLREIRRYKPDVLYAPGPAALPWSAVCGCLTQTPVIWHLHHVFLDTMTRKLLNVCGRWKAVRKILAVSGCVGDQLPAQAIQNKVEVIYNPVDAVRYGNGNPAQIRQELEQLLGKKLIGAAHSGKQIILGQIALIQRSKKQDFTLAVLAEMKTQGYDVVGLFPGECREQDFLDELKQLVCQLGLEKDVLFLGRREDIPDMLKLMDVLIIPSFEGFPLAGLEAAAAGVPVAACDIAGAGEFIRVSKNGGCFEENNAEKAAETILRLCTDRETYAENGRLFAARCSKQRYQVQLEQTFADPECSNAVL